MENVEKFVTDYLTEAGVRVRSVEVKSYDDQEVWIKCFVDESSIDSAHSLLDGLESRLLDEAASNSTNFTIVFRKWDSGDENDADSEQGSSGTGLHSKRVANLVSLLEARSRASETIPSLSFVQDHRMDPGVIQATRHQFILGRRGVGKTSLLLQVRDRVVRAGNLSCWVNAQPYRNLDVERLYYTFSRLMLKSCLSAFPSVNSSKRQEIEDAIGIVDKALGGGTSLAVGDIAAHLNGVFKTVLRHDGIALFVFIDDFYLIDSSIQSQILEVLSATLKDSNAWLKLASIDHLTRPWNPSTHEGLEIPHDATKVDIDQTLENPGPVQNFLETVLASYVRHVGLRNVGSIAKPEARGRLALASGGVTRDYLDLVARSIKVATNERPAAKALGAEDVSKAAGAAALSKRQDLVDDVAPGSESEALVGLLDAVTEKVRDESFTYFRINARDRRKESYTLFARLVDLRFFHKIKGGLSDQHHQGVQYEAYILSLSEYAEVRLKRNLSVLDLVGGEWTVKTSGRGGRETTKLSDTQLRDTLRRGPRIDLDEIIGRSQVGES